ncbi:MAG: BlaI/MecI/CopY family transcriptional regulator [Oscillospiraceae bacterium]|nr:BlaI/MecI/CopY family transcriptional regulator [Oscillospiraceae bacterium]
MAITVSPAEWQIMEVLWQQPHTLMELVRILKDSEGWAKSTVTTLVRRLEQKGIIGYEAEGRTKTFHPIVTREEIVAQQSESLLQRAYHGSLGLFLSSMVQRNNLTREDIDELHKILHKAEENME